MAYLPLPAPRQRRSFAITVGLAEGYGGGRQHGLDAAVAVHGEWMKAQIAAGQPYLTGLFTAAMLSYAWPRPENGGEGHVEVEPAAVFSGEVSVLYQAHLSDAEVVALLNDLAAQLGESLRQFRVYVAYRDQTWVLESAPAGATG